VKTWTFALRTNPGASVCEYGNEASVVLFQEFPIFLLSSFS